MLYIMRHGQTNMNQARVMQGQSNHPLNDTGREQARTVGRRFKELGISFDLVFSSPLDRAVDTAKLVSGKDPVTDPRLLEMDYGPYEGTSLNDLPEEILYFFRDFQNHPAPEGMEQLSAVVARTGDFVEEIKELAKDKNILISTHAISMKGILEYLTPEKKGCFWSQPIANCQVYTTEVRDGAYTAPQAFAI